MNTYVLSESDQHQKMDREFEEMVQRMNQMKKKMMEGLLKDNLEDNLMDDFLNDPFFDDETIYKALQGRTQKPSFIDHYWKNLKDGKILVIVPKDKEVKLDIKVENQMVKLSMEKKVVEKKESQGSSSQVQSIQSFNYSIGVDPQLDFGKHKISQKDNEIHIQFPYRKGGKSQVDFNHQKPKIQPDPKPKKKSRPLPEDVI
jgi:hypothetical protein